MRTFGKSVWAGTLGLAMTLAGPAMAQAGSDTPAAATTDSSTPPTPSNPPPESTSGMATSGDVSASPETGGTRPGEVPWFGMGVKLGLTKYNLSAGNVPVVGQQIQDVLRDVNQSVAAFNAASGANNALYNINDMSLNDSVFMITPTFHLGGDGYFFKFDVPIGLGGSLTTFGLGIYPINYGYHIENLKMMPYLSLGLNASYATSGSFTPAAGGAATKVSAMGPILNGRIALGGKYFAMEGLALGLELAFSPVGVGGVIDTTNVNAFTALASGGAPAALPPNPGTAVRGGMGNVLDAAISVEWM